MGPSELLSVRLFKQHIAGHLPEYSAVDDANVLQTLQRSFSTNLYDSAEFLKIQLKNNQVDFAQVIEEFVSDLADHYVQRPDSSDPVIEQLLKNNYFSFTSKIEAAKELQLVIQRSERKRLKEMLRANDEEQEAEDLKIVFERLERKALKKRLQEQEEFRPTANDGFFSRLGSSNKRAYYGPSQNSKPLKGYSSSSNFGMWLRVAAILLVILIPAGILLYRNIMNETVPAVAETGDKPESTDDAQYLASEDISGLLDIRLPDVSIKQVFSEIDSDLDRGQGYASEDVTKIKIEVISKASQLKYLKLKADSIYRKQTDFKSQLKQGNAKKQDPIELRKRIEQLEIARMKCDQLADQIQKSDMLYEFTLTNLKLYLNKDIDPKRFTVREEINPDTREMEYFLLLDDKVYKQLYLLKSANRIGTGYSNVKILKYSRWFSDIGTGEKILCFFAPGCKHCIDVAKDLVCLSKEMAHFPSVQILFMDEDTELIPAFFNDTGLKKSYKIADIASFWDTIGENDTPFVVYLRNGNEVASYSGEEFNKRKFKIQLKSR